MVLSRRSSPRRSWYQHDTRGLSGREIRTLQTTSLPKTFPQSRAEISPPYNPLLVDRTLEDHIADRRHWSRQPTVSSQRTVQSAAAEASGPAPPLAEERNQPEPPASPPPRRHGKAQQTGASADRYVADQVLQAKRFRKRLDKSIAWAEKYNQPPDNYQTESEDEDEPYVRYHSEDELAARQLQDQLLDEDRARQDLLAADQALAETLSAANEFKVPNKRARRQRKREARRAATAATASQPPAAPAQAAKPSAPAGRSAPAPARQEPRKPRTPSPPLGSQEEPVDYGDRSPTPEQQAPPEPEPSPSSSGPPSLQNSSSSSNTSSASASSHPAPAANSTPPAAAANPTQPALNANQAQAAPAQQQNNAAQPLAAAQLNQNPPAHAVLNPPAAMSAKQRKELLKAIDSALYQTFDQYIANQDNTPAGWIDMFEKDLRQFGVQPDQAVPFLKEKHFGSSTANAMAKWREQNRGASWRAFREAFLKVNPGKPPVITRQSWKRLSMHSCGSYHNYLMEFNRQRALISVGPDELIETFLAGLSSALRSQVEFYKHRRWKPSEFDKLVHATTERVNNSAVSATGGQTTAENKHSAAPNRSGMTNQRQNRKRDRSAAGRNATRPAPAADNGASNPANVGRSREETLAIGHYCHMHQPKLCKYCSSSEHAHQACTRRNNPVPWDSRKPADWNQDFWYRKAMARRQEIQQQQQQQQQPGQNRKRSKK